MTQPLPGISDAGSAAQIFRDRLPRVYTLKDMLADPSHPDAYFQDFEKGLATHKSKLDAFLSLERQLGVLDDTAWEDLKARASVHLVSRTRGQGRGWQELFDVFSEAKGYGYLKSAGCTEIRFIPRGKSKTPDLGAMKDGMPVFCEVKTINMSAEEAGRRKRIGDGEAVATDTSVHAAEGFLNKLRLTLENAVSQIDAVDAECRARRIVFTVVHFDDWVGDYQPQYFADMDDCLERNPVAGAELVFSPASNLFGRTFTMRSATVFQPEG